MDVLDGLVARARSLAADPGQRVLIGIAGAPGAGKSTLAAALVARLGGFPRAVQVPMDGFHLADAELGRLARTERKGAPDTFDPDGYAALLARLRGQRLRTVWAPGFERTLEQPIAQAIAIVPETDFVVSEGNYLLLPDLPWQQVRAHFDEVWFCAEDDALRLRRLIARHVEFGKSPEAAREWVQRSDERNAELVAATREFADHVVDLRNVELRDVDPA